MITKVKFFLLNEEDGKFIARKGTRYSLVEDILEAKQYPSYKDASEWISLIHIPCEELSLSVRPYTFYVREANPLAVGLPDPDLEALQRVLEAFRRYRNVDPAKMEETFATYPAELMNAVYKLSELGDSYRQQSTPRTADFQISYKGYQLFGKRAGRPGQSEIQVRDYSLSRPSQEFKVVQKISYIRGDFRARDAALAKARRLIDRRDYEYKYMKYLL